LRLDALVRLGVHRLPVRSDRRLPARLGSYRRELHRLALGCSIACSRMTSGWLLRALALGSSTSRSATRSGRAT
jgi:hypothetical protein